MNEQFMRSLQRYLPYFRCTHYDNVIEIAPRRHKQKYRKCYYPAFALVIMYYRDSRAALKEIVVSKLTSVVSEMYQRRQDYKRLLTNNNYRNIFRIRFVYKI